MKTEKMVNFFYFQKIIPCQIEVKKQDKFHRKSKRTVFGRKVQRTPAYFLASISKIL